MPGEPARFDALVDRFMKLSAADRQAVLASLAPPERDLIEREVAAARDEQRRERDRRRRADRQFVGYSPWLAAIISAAARSDDDATRARTDACNEAIIRAHRSASELHTDEGPLARFLRQFGISALAADADARR